ncbi:histidine phosphatase family protein [uncultured Actinomyces sp.]|uniref:histidine phosphatase family protein n=1 Tax=uncultured Actinomyces sp. TaxID=249061 RepID=UPI0028DCF2EB|nr:histidine phosphatase family protein [uncultured Actinomyces sp.]
MATLHLVRHGRTVLNEQHRTQGRADSPLTPQGRQGALAVGAYLREVPFVHAYTSPQGRVLETTDLLLAGREDVPRTVLSGLREYDYGVYEAGPDEVMLAALPARTHLPAVLAGRDPGAPGGVRARDYLARTDAALARIVADLRRWGAGDGAGPHVLVVSHGMTLTSLVARWVSAQVLGREPMANCSVTTLEVDPADPARPRLLAWAADPAGQGVTFPSVDLAHAFDGVVPVPVDLTHPEGLTRPQGEAGAS